VFWKQAGVVGVALSACISLAGCDGLGARSCTDADCASHIRAVVKNAPPEAALLTLCKPGRCRTVKHRDPAGLITELPCDDEPATIPITAEVRNSARRVLLSTTTDVELHKVEPNGPDCGPTCWSADLVVDMRTGELRVRDFETGEVQA
jgi:hypothetical protein